MTDNTTALNPESDGTTTELSSMGILPVYKGYSCDIRLREFRKARIGKMIAFVPFDSELGTELYNGMRDKGMNMVSAPLNTPEGWENYKKLAVATHGRNKAKVVIKELEDLGYGKGAA
jgi:hypothetical protein